MPPLLSIDLLRYQNRLRLRQQEGKRWLFDEVRKKWLVLQPEELVRQLTVHYLLEEKGYNRNRISTERGLNVNTLNRRFDLLVYDMQMQPFLLIECKAPEVPLKQATFDQIAVYNSQLNVPYLMITNGIDTYCYRINHERKQLSFLNTVPLYQTTKTP